MADDHTLDLFAGAPSGVAALELAPATGQAGKQRALGQFMTPHWAAEALVQRSFSDLGAEDFVVEMTCGTGAFLNAIPAHVPAVGIEIDPELAEYARHSTGRRVITGDFRTVAKALRATAIVGNPPFFADIITELLDACRGVLPEGGRAGFIIPAYLLQTPSRVVRYNRDWSIEVEMLPRTLFKGLQCPLSWGVFRRDNQRHLIGMALYAETADIEGMTQQVRDRLNRSPGTWADVVSWAIDTEGGQASLERIYAAVEPKRPTGNPAWREQIRKVVRTSRRFRATAPGVYAHAA